jgi:hypothetical protein
MLGKGKAWKLWAAAALSAGLLELPFPLAGPLPVWRTVFAWFGLVPLLWALLSPECVDQPRALRRSFLLAYLCGVLWYAGNCYWVRDTMMRYGDMPLGAPTLLLVAFSLVLGLYFGLFGLGVALVRQASGSARLTLVAAPFLWVAQELAAARITSSPWDQLGYSQVDNALVNQLAPWTGVYGISFVLVAVNALLAGGLLLNRASGRLKWAMAGCLLLCGGTAGIFLAPPRPAATPSAAGYGSWREYCCGDPDSNGYGGAFVPNPGDHIYTQEWYCDSKGNLNLNGGYGCTFLEDDTTGSILSCTQAGGSPCWSVKASSGMTLGKAAEFIIENQSPQVSSSSTAFTDFTPTVTMSGSAYTSKTNAYSQTISSDPNVNLLTDFTNTTTHIVVTLGNSDQTYFSMEASQPSYPLYCQGPLKTSTAPTPLTPYKWASEGAGAKAPGPGECAWADRGPRGIEIKSGDSNEIMGYLNQLANLPAGKYMEIGVYRDPNYGNDMMVTKIVGFVTPPFSAKPVLP